MWSWEFGSRITSQRACHLTPLISAFPIFSLGLLGGGGWRSRVGASMQVGNDSWGVQVRYFLFLCKRKKKKERKRQRRRTGFTAVAPGKALSAAPGQAGSCAERCSLRTAGASGALESGATAQRPHPPLERAVQVRGRGVGTKERSGAPRPALWGVFPSLGRC